MVGVGVHNRQIARLLKLSISCDCAVTCTVQGRLIVRIGIAFSSLRLIGQVSLCSVVGL